MPSLSRCLRRFAAVAFITSVVQAQYVIQDTYDAGNFFNTFDFFSESDPTHGFVKYASAITANNSALAGYSNNGVYLGVDHTTVNPVGGRASVRVSSKKTYTRGLFIADIAHMPGSICGVWPSLWTFGSGGGWPNSGEIDIIEGVSTQTTNVATLHTSPGCTMSNTGSAPGTTLPNGDCNSNNGYNGCSQYTSNTQGYGDGFNANGGGIYAMEWTHHTISIWFFPRNAIPGDLHSAHPVPGNWGLPQARFVDTGCNLDNHFKSHNIIFDTTFCGDWAGSVWQSSPTCPGKAATCNDFVAQNPAAFQEAYWLINSVKVYSAEGVQSRGLTPVPFMA